jgi:tetrahydromethanopterin S-methyltransferase subunit F
MEEVNVTINLGLTDVILFGIITGFAMSIVLVIVVKAVELYDHD